jgi:23S rRNA (pseudouridine1915-N3)-methyltransferase
MHLHVLAVGKLREPYWTAGCREYSRRLAAYGTLEIVEIAEEKIPERTSPAEETALKTKEGQRLLKRLRPQSYTIALAIEGKPLASEELAQHLKNITLSGKSDFTFIIGGTLGLSSQVLQQADFLLSLSHMTFPHQMVRLFLLEQLYRACKILRGEPYHR